MLGELLLLLHNVILQVDKDDRWLWTLKSSNVYFVRSAYRVLIVHPPLVYPVTVSELWHKDIPLKVVLFVIGCLQKTTCIIVVFLIETQGFV